MQLRQSFVNFLAVSKRSVTQIHRPTGGDTVNVRAKLLRNSTYYIHAKAVVCLMHPQTNAKCNQLYIMN